MQIVIYAKGLTLESDLKHHIEKRLHFALNWAKYHVSRVSVRLSDLNGPKGGLDKSCHIQLSAPGLGTVVIKDTESSFMTAIDRAADRIGHTLSRKLGRKHPRHSTKSLSPALENAGL